MGNWRQTAKPGCGFSAGGRGADPGLVAPTPCSGLSRVWSEGHWRREACQSLDFARWPMRHGNDGEKNAHRVAFLQAGYGVTLAGRAMGSEFDIRPIREASAFGAGIDRCVVIRENSTKIPSPRIDPGERPTGPGWRGKEGTASGVKNKEGAQSLFNLTEFGLPPRTPELEKAA